MSKAAKYARNIVVGIGSRVIQIVGGYGTLWLLTDMLSASGYGGYVTAFAITSLVSFVGMAGLKQATVQRVGELSVEDESEITHYAGAAVTLVVLGSLILSVLTMITAPLASYFVDPTVVTWIQLLAFVVPGMAVLPVCSGVLRGMEYVSSAIILEQILVQTLRVTGLFAVWLYWQDIVAVTAAIAVAYYFPILVLALRTNGWQYLNVSGMSLSHLKYSGFLFLTSIANQFLKNTDILLLSTFVTLSVTGGYNVAWKIAIVGRYADQILTTTIQPRLARFLTANEIGKLREEYDQTRDLSVVGALGVLVIVVLFGESLLGLFGTYASFYGVLVILTFGAVVDAAFGSIGQILMMSKRSRLLFANTLVNLGGNVTLNLLLIPVFGAIGAAVATVLTAYTLANAVAMLEVKYLLDIDMFDGPLLLGAGLIGTSVLLRLQGALTTDLPFLLVAAVLAGSLLYRQASFLKDMAATVLNTTTLGR